MPAYHLLNVFTDESGAHGNALGVFLEGAAVPPERRQAVAAELGYSETVFVDDVARGELRIHTPATELPLAGHPLVGAAWVIAREHGSCQMLRPPAGDVPTWAEGELRWIRARPELGPQMELIEFGSPEEVDALEGGPAPYGFSACWAWVDEAAGTVRVRVFADAAGIPEDEATGSAALRLCAKLGRGVEIRQGRGSVLHARPSEDGLADVGGRVRYVGAREHG
jgi:predicted PhzF superfamily epimerase YddE/YHI9